MEVKTRNRAPTEGYRLTGPFARSGELVSESRVRTRESESEMSAIDRVQPRHVPGGPGATPQARVGDGPVAEPAARIREGDVRASVTGGLSSSIQAGEELPAAASEVAGGPTDRPAAFAQIIDRGRPLAGAADLHGAARQLGARFGSHAAMLPAGGSVEISGKALDTLWMKVSFDGGGSKMMRPADIGLKAITLG